MIAFIFFPGATPVQESFFGKPDGILSMAYVYCSRSEEGPDCSISLLGNFRLFYYGCGDGAYAGVKCQGKDK